MILRILTLPFLCLLLVSLPAYASTRHALVIGNDAYDAVPVLQKAVNDANAVGATLTDMGFVVTRATNVTRRDMNRAIQKFVSGIQPGDVAMLFYAGHGIEIDGQNFLLPTDIPDAGPGQEGFVQGEAIALNGILDRITARKARLNVVILDACRNNPFAREGGRSLGGTRGLARVNAPTGTFVMYSADAGEAALDRLEDGDKNPNSVFTRTLLPLMKTPGMDLVKMARETRRQVRKLASTARHQQTPAYYDAVLGDFYFTAPDAVAVVAKPVAPAQSGISAAYAAAAQINTAKVWKRFLQEFGAEGGFYVDLAQEAMAQLEPKVAAISPQPRPAPKPAPTRAPTPYDLTQLAPKQSWPKELTVVSWGGLYSQSQKLAYHDPYSRRYKVKVREVTDAPTALSDLRKMAKSKQFKWDLVDVVGADAQRACDEGLAMKIDHDAMLEPAPDGTPASEDFAPFISNDCVIPQIVYSVTVAYRTGLSWGRPPTSVCDLFDLARYPGKRALQMSPRHNLVWALQCDGVPKDQIYQTLGSRAGVTRALKKLDSIKAQTIWWRAGADTPQLLKDGKVVMGTSYNGRFFNNAGQSNWRIQTLWDGQFLDIDGWIIPKGLPKARLARALHYVRFATNPKQLAKQASYIPYGPARASSVPLIGKHQKTKAEMVSQVPTGPGNLQNSYLENGEFWAKNNAWINPMFETWVK